MTKTKREQFERYQFTLDECKTQINIIPTSDDKGYATAFLNVHLPDGRWLVFKTDAATRIPLYKRETKK